MLLTNVKAPGPLVFKQFEPAPGLSNFVTHSDILNSAGPPHLMAFIDFSVYDDNSSSILPV